MAALANGARLGPYEVLGPLGAGGMGEVYRARDTRLGRVVAIKRLNDALSGDPASRERIEREARSVASLTHPNICTLHDVGTHDGSTYLVMELLEGETLAARVSRNRGGLPIEDVLRIGSQIADALAYAHRQRIVHRDLKPANVMLTSSAARLLDFGLAKVRERDGLTDETKTQAALTGATDLLGTLPYMSPEQLDGRADERSDIFALGAVLFEMLTGSRAFDAETSPALIAAIMSTDPPSVTSMRPEVSPAIGRIVRRCLAKDPEQRWQSAADLAEALRWLATDAANTAATKIGTPRRIRAPIVIAAALAIGAVIALVGPLWRSRPGPALSQLSVVTDAVSFPFYGSGIALSPDRVTTAFSATTGTSGSGVRHLFIRRMDARDAQLVAGTENAIYPCFSPDGKSIAFFADGKIKRWSIPSGSLSVIAELREGTNGADASWGADDAIVFGESSDRPDVGIRRVPASGGAIEVLTRPDYAAGEQTHFGPQQLDSGTILFTVRSNGKSGREYKVVARHADATITDVIPGASLARYIGGKQIVYQVDNALMLAAFDPVSLMLTNARRIVDGVLATASAATWGIADDVIAYHSIDPPRRRLTWVDRAGVSAGLALPPGDYANPRISPSGDRFAVVASDYASRGNVWIANLQQQTLTPLTTDGLSYAGIWNSDGTEFIGTRLNGAARDVFAQRTDGSGAARLLLQTGEQLFVASLGADRRTLVVMKPTNGNRDIWLFDLAGERPLRPIVDSPAVEYGGRVSPNGKWMTYFSDASGRHELYVTPFPAGGPRWQVSRDGAREAVWSWDGHELFFRDGDRMFVTKVHDGDRFIWDQPRVLFSGAFFRSGGPGSVHYDVAADGRFLMIEEIPVGAPSINVIQGWRQLVH